MSSRLVLIRLVLIRLESDREAPLSDFEFRLTAFFAVIGIGVVSSET